MILELTGMEIANCSLLDEATAAAEAMTMMYALRNKEMKKAGANKLFVDNKVFSQTKDVLITRSAPQGIELVCGDYDTFEFTGDVFGSMRCDCGEQLAEALRRIEKAGRGVLVYLRQEGRGIGLINKLKAYELQEKGMDTVEANIALGFPADLREYDTGGAILADLGVRKLVLMTNNPLKIEGLDHYGIDVAGRDPIEMTCNEKNRMYMYTKYKKMGHMLHFSSDDTGLRR